MKIGIFSDIHGNLPALEVILDKFSKEQCEIIYSLGDILSIGPFQKECCEKLLELDNIKFIKGNHEEFFLNGIPKKEKMIMAQGEIEHLEWVRKNLNMSIKNKMQRFDYLIKEKIDNISIAFLHYAVDFKNNEISFIEIDKAITQEKLDNIFSNVDADIIFYGHEHKSSNIEGGKHYINVGSSGCTFNDITTCTILEVKNQNYSINKYELKYNRDLLLREFEIRNVPERKFIKRVFYGEN